MRDYDPTTGRFIQADPLGLVDGASVYGYALQNPGRWVDPRGEFTKYDAIKSLRSRGVAPENGSFYSTNQWYSEWKRMSENVDWTKSLPKCPPKKDLCVGIEWQEIDYFPDGVPYHPGGFYSVRSRIVPGGHANQCIYDEDGDLITTPPGAGSADYRGYTGLADRIPHFLHDVVPFYAARDLNDLSGYYSVRPEVSE